MEFEFEGNNYRSNKIDTFTQMNLLARCGPLLETMVFARPAGTENASDEELTMLQINSFLKALHSMTDEERRYVCEHCLSVVQRRQTNGSTEVWSEIFRNGRFMFSDIDELPSMFRIVATVLQGLFVGFLSTRGDGLNGSTELPRPTLVSNG